MIGQETKGWHSRKKGKLVGMENYMLLGTTTFVGSTRWTEVRFGAEEEGWPEKARSRLPGGKDWLSTCRERRAIGRDRS